MPSFSFRLTGGPHRRLLSKPLLAVLVVLGVGLSRASALAQSDVGGGDAGGCVLKDHVYTCDGAALQKALAAANTVAIETHNSDGFARSQLKDFVTKKLGKTIAPAGSPADLDILLIPTQEGIINGSMGEDLGTLRVYTSGPNGGRGHLLWAEGFSGPSSTPWMAVVRGLIAQFESHFHIK